MPHPQPVLSESLGSLYEVYDDLIDRISSPDYGLVASWRYYKDGKSWLCKVTYGGKTVFWLSVWQSFFKMSFYFTSKSSQGVGQLSIDESIKSCLSQSKPTGKLVPLVLDIRSSEQIADVLEIVKYKRELK
ncbi:MAG: DUF3788 family protein [Tenuifilaceae bacterium]|nr:DUF3788 family protein [Tenuifilaceae bacterium]